jgi:hypothetical protein
MGPAPVLVFFFLHGSFYVKNPAATPEPKSKIHRTPGWLAGVLFFIL